MHVANTRQARVEETKENPNHKEQTKRSSKGRNFRKQTAWILTLTYQPTLACSHITFPLWTRTWKMPLPYPGISQLPLSIKASCSSHWGWEVRFTLILNFSPPFWSHWCPWGSPYSLRQDLQLWQPETFFAFLLATGRVLQNVKCNMKSISISIYIYWQKCSKS